MIDSKHTEGFYFVGIGGIGMSALARYFLEGGYAIAGYDRTESALTMQLAAEGCSICYDDSSDCIPVRFRDSKMRDRIVVVYTPAIPETNSILKYFRQGGYGIIKRAEILGAISEKTDTLAVAGTHGKTTVSTILAHLLKVSHLDCSAFLGGISKNYNSNLITGDSRYTVMEADEFDRSFLYLTPHIAVVTSVDADHLDVYGDRETMVEAYNEFCSGIRVGGAMVVNKKIAEHITPQRDVLYYSYGIDDRADFYAFNIEPEGDYYRFDIKRPSGVIRDIYFSAPGLMNVENAVAACAVALLAGATETELRKALLCYRGVKRRFDIVVSRPEIVYIDDYAHHPEEIVACVNSVREQYPGKVITGVFQPHLYTRTRDHASTFAAALDRLDKVLLMPVYAAREEPVDGVDTSLILNAMTLDGVRMVAASEVVEAIDYENTDVLITIGAGDIDRLVKPIEEKINSLFRL